MMSTCRRFELLLRSTGRLCVSRSKLCVLPCVVAFHRYYVASVIGRRYLDGQLVYNLRYKDDDVDEKDVGHAADV